MPHAASAFRWTIVLLLVLLAPARLHAEIIDRIMAVVGGQPITLSDVNGALLFRLVDPPGGTRDPLAHALDRLIDRTLMLGEVDRFQPPEPAPVEIALRVTELEQRAGSPEAFTKALTITGLTREQLQRHIRDDLRITTYLNQRFGTNADAPERATAIAQWTAEIRRRADVIVQYQPR
jgi:hypothetical protein